MWNYNNTFVHRCDILKFTVMTVTVSNIKKLPKEAKIIGAKGHRKNGKGVSIVRYRVNNQEFTAWIPVGGGAA